MTNHEIAQRIALRELVDTFSNLADEKNVAAQMPLFTADAHINVVMDGKEVFDLKGHQQILDALVVTWRNSQWFIIRMANKPSR